MTLFLNMIKSKTSSKKIISSQNAKKTRVKTISSKQTHSEPKKIMITTTDLLRINSSVDIISKQRLSSPSRGVVIEIADDNTIMSTSALHDIISQRARLKEENYALKDKIRRLSRK